MLTKESKSVKTLVKVNSDNLRVTSLNEVNVEHNVFNMVINNYEMANLKSASKINKHTDLSK